MNFKITFFLLAAIVACNNSNIHQNSNKPFQFKALTYVEQVDKNNVSTIIFDLDKMDSFQLKKGDKFDLIKGEKRINCEFIEVKPSSNANRKSYHCKSKDDYAFLFESGEIPLFVVNTGAALKEEIAVATNETNNRSTVVLKSKLDGKTWNGNSASFLYYAKGVKMMDKEGRPYLQLAFTSAQSPDSRQLTFNSKNFKGELASLPNMEVLFSGSKEGNKEQSEIQGYQENPNFPEQKTNFKIEVTKWEMQGANKAILSAKFCGKLKGLMGAPDVEFTDGVFENIEVIVYTEKY